jgi:hypothetical protein
MATTNFKPMLPKLVASHFPSVENFHIDYNAEKVQPIKYKNAWGHKNEWPPVVYWRVGTQLYSYVLKPTFKTRQQQMFPFFSNITIYADYSAENNTLWQLLQWSVEGKTTDSINYLLSNNP